MGIVSEKSVRYIDNVKHFIGMFDSKDPVYSYRIEESYGLSGSEVRSIVHHLRCEGVPIGSGHKGYYMARTPDEIETTIEHMIQREQSIRHAREGLQRAFGETDKGLTLSFL
jgi:biotin operon repressor